MLYELGLRNIEIVPRVDEIQHGIQHATYLVNVGLMRQIAKRAWQYLVAISKGNGMTAKVVGRQAKRHDIHSEAADAFRQFAQGYKFRQQIKQNQSRPVIVESGLTPCLCRTTTVH